MLCQNLLEKSTRIEWTKWRIFLADERFVHLNDSDSTFGFYKDNLFDPAEVPNDKTFPIQLNLPLDQAAQAYQNSILSIFPKTEVRFDLIVLGMGPDGHTCSLFPDHASQSLIVPIFDSPKNPPKRISFSLKMLNQAHSIIFAVCGKSKSSAIRVIEL
ncbi:probable 6-phosphogluconolactonase [Octopus sinensis]|uniref:6-phosphogluconolactonase n=1 Tax=Octopus sinensis TaxID=2607531 RepID=A0A6P7TY23_9MOLL|nr:probable 6-phosphogluconolactonase [Octopus sinensis]